MDTFFFDTSLGTAALSSPLWLQMLESSFGFGVLVGGAVLLVLRIIISWREYKRGKQDG